MTAPHKRFDLEVFSYRELELYPVGANEALVLVVDNERWPSRVPDAFVRHLRLRFPFDELVDGSFDAHQSLLRNAHFALDFARLHGPSVERIAVASPDGEVRGPGLAMGLQVALEFPSQRIHAMAQAYPRLSRTLRDHVLQAAGKLPPTRLEKAAHSPLTKAALLLLAKITEGRFHH